MRRLRCCNRKLLFFIAGLVLLAYLSLVFFYERIYVGLSQRRFISNSNSLQELNELEAKTIFRFLNQIDAFLIDINKIRLLFGSQNDKEECRTSVKHTKFGIFDDSLPLLYFKFRSYIDISKYCKYKLANGTWYASSSSSVETVVSSIYLYCKEYKVQIAVFYKRGDFYWIPSDVGEVHKPKWFGDVPRGMNKFQIVNYYPIKNATIHNSHVRIPSNLRKFLFDYEHSTFLECNRTMVELNYKRSNGEYTQNRHLNDYVMPRLRYLTQTLEGMYKHYWLASGTLLGWYRDCSIIRHTVDADIFIWNHEYDKRIKEAFLGNPYLFVWLIHGFVDDAYEIRLASGGFTYDLISVYKLNSTTQTSSYHVKLGKYTQYLPNFEKLCSAELHGAKFMIPCDPVKYLNRQYGDMEDWSKPTVRKYRLKNIEWDSPKEWREDERPIAMRYYFRNGTYNANRTLNAIDRINLQIRKKL